MTTFDVLKEKLRGRRDPNSFTILWDDKILPCGTTWSTGYDTYEIIPFDWGFQLMKDNGLIAPPTQINFGKFATENDFYGAFDRAMSFVKKNCNRTEGLPAYMWGE